MSTTVITKPKVDISPELLKEIKTVVHEQGQVVLHFILYNLSTHESAIRIWPTSYLYDNQSSHVSDLMHVENITMFPVWQTIPPLSTSYFTLIFSGLPRACSSFDFVEDCKGSPGAWSLKGISRNESDVYYLRIG